MEYKVGDNELRDLLKVGYKIKTIAKEAVIKNQTELNSVKSNFNEKLDSSVKGIGLIAIYKPKYNGIKPMEWELVWERKEHKYYLRSWINGEGYVVNDVLGDKRNYLNSFVRDNVLFISNCKDSESCKTQFTQKEIDAFPNQGFIKTLVKEEVK